METLIFKRVRDEKYLVLQNRMPAKRNISASLGRLHARARLEPLPIRIDQAYDCDWYAKHLSRQSGQAIKALLSGCIEDIQVVQACHADVFVWRIGCGFHVTCLSSA